MPLDLKRYQTNGDNPLITISCHDRLPYFNTPEARDRFERSLEQTRLNYSLRIHAYVVMPEHVHLLLSEPDTAPLSKAIQSVKLSVSKLSPQRPFWTPRYHDFNVFTPRKFVEKRRYIHRNPVARGLVDDPEHWPHSTYLNNHQPTVQIASL